MYAVLINNNKLGKENISIHHNIDVWIIWGRYGTRICCGGNWN